MAYGEKDSMHNRTLGERGERAALRHLASLGFEVLETNWTCPAGEADIIAYDGCALVFIEVKTRSNIAKGLPSEAVTEKKRRRYERIAAWYLHLTGWFEGPVRFDVIGILTTGPDSAFLRHYVNAFGERSWVC